MPRIAAVDFGLKRIGIALSDMTKMMALPLMVVPGGSLGIEHVAKALEAKKNEIEKIIVGLPLLMNGKKGDMAHASERFAAALEQKLSIPVELVDERLTSKQADTALRELSLSRKKRTASLDTSAAALLLQSYLDAIPS